MGTRLSPAADTLEAFLACDDVVDWRHPAVQSLAARLTGGVTEDVERTRALFEWVRDTIPHTADIQGEAVTCSASEVLEAGTGICYAKSHLLAALLRASGLPAGFCYQTFENELHPGPDQTALHGLNGVYLPSLGRWIRLDARGNKPGVDAQFSLDDERLAFPEDPLLDDQVYPDPLPEVVEALRTYRTRTELWPHLPVPRRR
ncbi:MAG: transglutaminase-like superfamily protein [Armatimonadetes bacterium]|nr:transglutaminase-like superfamily protein [Armatimonadota bacterium]